MVGEDAHLCWCVERFVYLVVRSSLLLHHTPSLALLHRSSHYVVILLRRQVAGVGRVALAAVLAVEGRLQIFHHMFVNSFLGIALHTRVDSGINLQSVGIDVVCLSVLLRVLVAPSVERVVIPVY